MAKPVLLTVDDDADVLRSVERDLRKKYGARYRVLAADSGASALDLLKRLEQRNEPVALFLVDHRMPNMTGVELVPKALAQDSDLAVIMLTAIDEPRTAIECMKLGAYDYLIKPVDLDELEMSLQGALRLRQLEVDRRQLEQFALAFSSHALQRVMPRNEQIKQMKVPQSAQG